MAASKSKAHSLPPHEPPLILEKNTKLRKPRRNKAKEDSSHIATVTQPSSSFTRPSVDSLWSWTALTDSAASSRPAIFTKDGSYFFSIVGSSVKIYASSTGHVVSTLSASPSSSSLSPSGDGHKQMITSALLNPHNPFQLITASLDGHIKLWDYLDAVLLQTIDIERPILQMVAHEKFKDYVFVAASRRTKKMNSNGNPIEDNAVVLRVLLKPSDATVQSLIQTPSEIRVVGKTRTTTGLALSPSGSWLVAIAGHKAYVCMTSTLNSGFTKFVSTDRLTCLVFHPTEDYFATGDVKGVIKLWYCLNDVTTSSIAFGVEKKAQTTSLHWHAHAVSSLTFTPNGSYLLSGGLESVLVIWQLHTGKKEFVPRVGAPISSITISPANDTEEEYLLGLSDASYAFVSSGSLRISRTYSRIKLDPAISYDWPPTSTSVPLAMHSLTSTLILPSSHPSSLQIYSPSSSTLVSEVEVSPSNRVSRRDEKLLEPFRVRQVVVSPSGDWMATVDDRESSESIKTDAYLKIWWWDRKSGFWILNTRVDRPHGSTKVTSISFSPNKTNEGLLLVTSGEDNQVKSWRIRSTKNKNGKNEEFWVPRSAFSFRSETPSHVSWSKDGSLLAISSGHYVPLYDPITNSLSQVLTCLECQHVVSSHFLGSSGRYLAIAGRKDLVLWDLVSQSVQWHYRSAMDIDHVIPHVMDDTLALFHRSASQSSATTATATKILLFRPGSAIPFKSHTIPFSLSNVIWYQTCPSQSKFSLVGVTDTWNVVLLGDVVDLSPEDGSTPTQIPSDATSSSRRRTIFQDMFGISSFSDVGQGPSQKASSSLQATKDSKRFASVIFDVPAYLVPPLESLFDPLISDFLHRRPDAETSALPSKAEKLKDEDVQMDVDEVDDTEKPFLVGGRPESNVNAAVMNDLIELFKQYALTSSLSQRSRESRMQPNGVSKQNGVLANPGLTTNGITSPQVHPINGNMSIPTPTPTPLKVTTDASSPVTVGQKRKQSFSETH